MTEEMFEEFQEMSAQPVDTLTVVQLDQLVQRLQDLRRLYDEKKKAASEANAKVEEAENTIMGVLEKLGKNSYEAEGIGRVTKCMKLVYRVPKTNLEKIALFEYIKSKHGEDALTSMVSVNHNTLTSWANKEVESGGVAQIPGLEAPTHVEYLQLRSAK